MNNESHCRLCPFLQEPPLPSPLRRPMVGVHIARVARTPRSQKPMLFTSAARRSSATATTLSRGEARVRISSNPPKEPTKGVEGIMGAVEGVDPLNATVTTLLCKRPCTAAALQAMEVRMYTTCRTKRSPPATTSTLYSTATASG